MRVPRKSDRLAWFLYLASIQYVVVQIIVSLRFSPGFSLRNNTISDLGNSFCGAYGNRLVCSPLHLLMNLSFIVVGLTMFFGSVYAYQAFTKSRATLLGFGLFALGGLGTSLVGLFPENTVSGLHILGAALPFLGGNVGLVVLGWSLKITKSLRVYTLITGLVTLIALVLLVTEHYLGLGQGGMERLAGYPQTLWMLVMGIYGLRRNRISTT